MNLDALKFDWNQVRAFLAAAEEGSLSAAARLLGLTQPTVSRQIAGLEEDLGVLLFERDSRSMMLTEAGHEVLAHVRAMSEAASRVSLSATKQATDITGVVTITATNLFAIHHLPSALVRLRQEAPGISVTILASNDVQDLTQREADISIRHARPEQPELIGKCIGDISARLCASAAFLEKHGRPKTAGDLSGLPFLGFEAPDRVIPVINSLGIELTPQNIITTTTSGVLQVELVRAGLGIGLLADEATYLYPDIEAVLPEMSPLTVPIWLVAHRELRTSRKIRLVYDLLAEALPKRRQEILAGS